MEVFYASPWIPAEWIEAHGLTGHGVWPIGGSTAQASSSPGQGVNIAGVHSPASPVPLPVPEGVCAVAQSFLRFAAVHPGAGMIFATTCDQMRRAFDECATGQDRVFLFNVPATWQSTTARAMYRAELERLGRFLQALGGASPSPENLVGLMRRYDAARRQLREAVPHLPAREAARVIARFHWDGALNPVGIPTDGTGDPPAGKSDRQRPVAVALVGGPLGELHWPLLDALEQAGARVALNATENGERSLLPCLGAGDQHEPPLPTLADSFFDHITDAFQRPNTRLYQWLGALLRQREVRGLVVWGWAGCDLWRAEAASFREAFGLPVLLLEAGETRAESSREWGRLQAFVEMLQ